MTARSCEAWLASHSDHGIAVVVETPEEVCRLRVTGRMVCAACGWTDHHPVIDCVRCGARLERRTDDTDAAAFERRMHDYDARVAPLIDAWTTTGLPLVQVDGTLDSDALTADLLAQLASLGDVAPVRDGATRPSLAAASLG